MSRALGLGPLALWLACSAAAPAPAPPVGNVVAAGSAAPPPSIAGAYRQPHEIQMVCDQPDGWCPEQVEDTLVVRDAGGGQVAVEIELMQTNGHSCSFAGTLAPVADAPAAEPQWRFHLADGDEGPCTLTLTLTSVAAPGDLLRLASDGCRYHCGARASLDATFDR